MRMQHWWFRTRARMPGLGRVGRVRPQGTAHIHPWVRTKQRRPTFELFRSQRRMIDEVQHSSSFLPADISKDIIWQNIVGRALIDAKLATILREICQVAFRMSATWSVWDAIADSLQFPPNARPCRAKPSTVKYSRNDNSSLVLITPADLTIPLRLISVLSFGFFIFCHCFALCCLRSEVIAFLQPQHSKGEALSCDSITVLGPLKTGSLY